MQLRRFTLSTLTTLVLSSVGCGGDYYSPGGRITQAMDKDLRERLKDQDRCPPGKHKEEVLGSDAKNHSVKCVNDK